MQIATPAPMHAPPVVAVLPLVCRMSAEAGPPERARSRLDDAPLLRVLLAALDELDYGVVVVDGDRRPVHANHEGEVELARGAALCLDERHVGVRSAADVLAFRQAVHDASARGRRRLLRLGTGSSRRVVSVVPLHPTASGAWLVLLVLGKNAVCERLSIEAYGRLHELTGAETKVLAALCEGDTPADIARRFGVALSTVRTQIGSLRAKTGARGIREVLRQVAVLPPLRCSLRNEAP
ncbi:MAG TPA: helix-turn-helix transcriptional regulator [Caldimonas sp.]|nr:helix-turn-helix transcriptional regulator [Caldimonas sp.]